MLVKLPLLLGAHEDAPLGEGVSTTMTPGFEPEASIAVTVVAEVRTSDPVYARVVVTYRMGVRTSTVPGVPFEAWAMVDVNGAVRFDEPV